MAISEAQKRAFNKWRNNALKTYTVQCHKVKESDMINQVQERDISPAHYIKSLIRSDMINNPTESNRKKEEEKDG